MDRNEVIAGVAGELHATEKALDDAIAHAATLVQTMIGARSALSLSAVAAAGSQTKAMEAIAALSTALTQGLIQKVLELSPLGLGTIGIYIGKVMRNYIHLLLLALHAGSSRP